LNNEIFDKIDQIEQSLLIFKGQRGALLARKAELITEIDDSDQKVNDLEEAIGFLTSAAKQARDDTMQSIESLATTAVNAVYDEPIEIRLQYQEKTRSDSSDKMTIQVVKPLDNGEMITGLMGEVGGGLIETVSFALRIAAIKWMGYTGPIILDEAYKSLSNDEKIEKIAIFLEELNKTVGNQIIFATHKQDVFGSIASKEFNVTIDKNSISWVASC
jgi:DNA repair exonuclease SbcCD ATPase subunit